MKGRPVVLVGVLALVIVAIGGVLVLRSPSRTGGDPGNATYRRLDRATRAIPATATDVRIRAAQPTDWSNGCPEFGAASHAGWTRTYLSATFDDAGARSQVLDQVDAALTRQGWVRHDEPTGPGRAVSPHWTIRPDGGRAADLFLFEPSGGAPTDWFLGVSWQPPGPVGSACP